MVILLRHGRTRWNAQDKSGDTELLRGNNPDIDLDAEGQKQVAAAAHEIRRSFPRVQFIDVRSSPFARDRSSRQIVAQVLGIPEQEDARLEPFNAGSLSEKPVALIWDLMALLMEAPALVPYDGESVGSWFLGWSEVYGEACRAYCGKPDLGEILIVHGMEMRSLPLLQGTGPMETYRQGTVHPGDFVVIA